MRALSRSLIKVGSNSLYIGTSRQLAEKGQCLAVCGRYVIISTPEAIRALFGYGEQPNFPPRYNVAPTQPIPVVRLREGKREFALVRWGLLPAWVKDPKGFTLL